MLPLPGPLLDGPVGAAEFERALARLQADPALPADPVAGFFGPGSALWQINSEAAIFLGAGRALLLQLAHPWVAAAVAEHGQALRDPIGRFHRTFETMFTLVFGTRDQALAKARALHARHAGIQGTLPGGTAYRANQIAALRFVWASLADTGLLVEERLGGPLPAARLADYWRDSRRLAGLFGLGADAVPGDGPRFELYWQDALAGDLLHVTPPAREIAAALMDGAGRRWLAWPGWYRTLTALLLPERLATGFGLARGPAEQAKAAAAWRRAAWVRRRLPDLLRQVAPRQEADARLRGRPPGPAVQLLNRVWIGRLRLSGPGPALD